MKQHSRKQRYTALLACFAILLALFMPSVSSALAAKNQDLFWSGICTTQNSSANNANHSLQASQDNAPHSGDSDMQAGHCAYCFTSAASFALPPAVALSLPIRIQALPLPALFYTSPSPLFVWASVQSRAPPSLT